MSRYTTTYYKSFIEFLADMKRSAKESEAEVFDEYEEEE